MDLTVLNGALNEMKLSIEEAIVTASYGVKPRADGHAAKEALIRSSTLINRLHEVVKVGLAAELTARGRQHAIHPPVARSSPELKITGFLKAKKQDVVVLLDGEQPVRERIAGGPLDGEWDAVGRDVSERSIVIGVRSQLSSVNKNFDTLMERAIAETLNLRLRLPGLVMGEVYLLPVREYDDEATKENRVRFKDNPVRVERFIKTFLGISGRDATDDSASVYKYERSALVLVDFQASPARVFLTLDELKEAGCIAPTTSVTDEQFASLSPEGFARDIVADHDRRHPRRAAAAS